MIIFPAIDIRNGKCVRLTQGDYDKETIYSNSPIEVAKQWEKLGATYIHIVDLDGARSGETKNLALIQSIASQINIPIQVGGGIRSLGVINDYITAGVERVIIGTAAIKNQAFLNKAVKRYGEQVAVSIDAKNGYVATDGWEQVSQISATDLLQDLEKIGVRTIVYTDILKDGMLKGPNFKELQNIQQASSIDIIASGGISSKANVKQLRAMNLYGAIIGKALYDKTISFKEIMEVGQ